MENNLVNLIAERTKKLEKIWSEYDAVQEEYNKKIADILPYKDKYIKITRENEYTQFCKVTDISIDKEKLYISGFWFFGDISVYTRENFLKYQHYMYSYYIRDIEKLVKSIEIITKEVYIEAYKKLSNDLIVDLEQM